MVAGVKDSLGYYTKNFGPYQHHILRIIEFPRFPRGGFAESFPNTVPFNEAIGFIAKVDDSDPKDIDYPYFVTAHEVAHQWWAHQEMPANVQGGEFITESLAEYSALMVLKQKYGDAKMRRFLKYELDRYLLGRSTEQKQEQPLVRADGPPTCTIRRERSRCTPCRTPSARRRSTTRFAFLGAGTSPGRPTRRSATCWPSSGASPLRPCNR